MNKNELKEAMNMEFSPLTGAMRVRGGLVWSARFQNYIDNVVPVRGRRGFLARVRASESDKKNKVPQKVWYFRWNNIWPVTGKLSGVGDVSAAAWDEPGTVLIASGGKLQKFSDEPLPTLTTIANSPDECRMVFVRNGRVGVVNGDDTITFSAVGDCESWEPDDDDDSSSKFIEVGYKDGMNINAIMPLSRDLIIFKAPPDEIDKGTIWRLSGDFPDWQLLEVAHNTGTFSQASVQAVGNDIYYITTAGLANLSSVTAYGEIKTAWPDRKVSSALVPLIDETAKLWDVPVKQQLWLLPTSGNSKENIWVLDYSRGIWTKFKFPENPIYAAGVDENLFIFIGRDIYEVNDGYPQDEMKTTSGFSKKTITAQMKLGTILSGRQTLIKGVFASFELTPECEAELVLGKFKMPFKIAGGIDYIYDPPNDTQYASEDDDPLFPEGQVLTSRRRCIIRDWQIAPEINIKGGGCSVSTLGLEMAEV